MAEVSVKYITNKEQWERFLTTRPEANFLQSWLWGEFQSDYGRKIYRSGFYRGDELAGVMLSIVEPARRAKYLTVGGGPIIDWQDEELVKFFVQELRRIGRLERCAFVRVRPQLLYDDFSTNLFAAMGFKQAPMHLHAELTSQLDITKSEDDLRAAFRKNTRYELKTAKKHGLVVSSTKDPDTIDKFYELEILTARRHGFVPYGQSFLKKQFTTFASADQALLYSAHTSSGELIAQAFVIFYGQEAAYHYGASTELGRKEPGAYAIQWEAIREAKRRGMSRYNFWGVVRPEQTGHRFYGVSVFKRGFRGDDIQYLHAQDLIIKPLRYSFNYVLESYRRRKRKLD